MREAVRLRKTSAVIAATCRTQGLGRSRAYHDRTRLEREGDVVNTHTVQQLDDAQLVLELGSGVKGFNASADDDKE